MRSAGRNLKAMRSQKIAVEEELRRSPPPAPARKKGAAVREWLVVSGSGQSYMEETGRHSIMRRTGLPARDLRVLDPMLSYPSTILGRERAIVINLDHIKAIITADEVLIPNSRDPAVTPFVQELQSRVAVSYSSPHPAMGSGNMDGEVAMATSRWPSSPGHDGSLRPGTTDSQKEPVPSQTPMSSNVMQERSPKSILDAAHYGGPKVLPFEFRALEVCLEFACRCLESETSKLEKEAYPALDELTSKISTLNLEHVRQIKSRLVAISGRVQKVRDELEHLLDDDMDMAAMYLTEKLFHRASSRFDLDNDDIEVGEESDKEPMDEIEGSNGILDGLKPDINELEMLLEAYFVQIDGTLNKISTLREYVDDTEDYINIMLDDKQNQLLQMGVVLSTASLIITMAVIVVGVLGINIHIPIFDAPYTRFWQTTGGLVASIIVAYGLAIVWGKKSGLLQW